MRLRLCLVVFGVLTAFEAGMMALADTSTRPIERYGRPFYVDEVAVGTVFTQLLEVRADGFNQVLLRGAISTGERPAVLRAHLSETDARGAVRVVRSGRIDVAAGDTTCCVFRFEPVSGSRWRSYRVEFAVEELGGRTLSLWLTPTRVNDALRINSRPKYASLAFRTFASTGTGAERLTAGGYRLLLPLALAYNAACAIAVALLASASDPQRT